VEEPGRTHKGAIGAFQHGDNNQQARARMFPIGDDNQEIRSTPVVTYGLIAVNVLAFVYELAIGRSLDGFLVAWGTIPVEITSGQDLHTLLTSMFLHGGFGHILGNMVFLKVFGDNVEDRFGPGPFLIFYLATGLAAALAHVLVNPASTIPTIGASGAISGVLGAYILLFHRNRVRVLLFYSVIEVPAWMMIGFWAAQQFVATLGDIAQTQETSGVAYAAHAGGFVAGLILTPLIAIIARRAQSRTRY